MKTQPDLHDEPLTRAQIDGLLAGDRRKLRLGIAITFVGVVMMTIAHGWLIPAGTALSVVAGFYVAQINRACVSTVRGIRPISGDDCRTLAQWWDQYPLIDAYCRRVIGQGREITQAEFWVAERYVEEQREVAARATLYARPDALPAPIDDAYLDELSVHLAKVPCDEITQAIALIDAHRGHSFDDLRDAKRFIDLMWEFVSQALDHGSYAPEKRHVLHDLEIMLAHRSIALRRIDFEAAPSVRTVAGFRHATS